MNLLIISILCSAFSIRIITDNDCNAWIDPENPHAGTTYKAYGGSCYMNIKTPGVRRTYEISKKICEDVGGHLPRVNDRLKGVILNNIMASLTQNVIWGDYFFHTDLSNLNPEGKMKYSDGSDVRYVPGHADIDAFKENVKENQVRLGNDLCFLVYVYTKTWQAGDCDVVLSHSRGGDPAKVEESVFCEKEPDDLAPIIFRSVNYNRLSLAVVEDNCIDYKDTVEACGAFMFNSIIVPEGWEVSIHSSPILPNDPSYNKEVDDMNEDGFGSPVGIYQGPLMIPVVNWNSLPAYINKNDPFRQVKVRKLEFEDYIPMFKSPGYKDFKFYVTQACWDILVCFAYVSGANDAISSLIIPGGWQVSLWDFKGFDYDSDTFYGPKKIDDMKDFNAYLNNQVSSFKIKKNSRASFRITDIYWDKAIVVKEEENSLENVVIDNPSEIEQSITMAKEYSEVREENWFTEKKQSWQWGGSLSMESELSSNEENPVIYRNQITIGFEFEHSTESTTNTGGSKGKTKTNSYEYSCIAQPFSVTTCNVVQVFGHYRVPYRGLLTFVYPDGTIEQSEYFDVLETKNGGRAFLEIKTINTKLNDKCEVIYRGKCYDLIDDGYSQTYEQAKNECYFSRKQLPKVEDAVINQVIHELCNYKSMWVEIGENGYSRFLPESMESPGLGNEKPMIQNDESQLGYWKWADESTLAECVVCVGEIE